MLQQSYISLSRNCQINEKDETGRKLNEKTNQKEMALTFKCELLKSIK